MNIDWTKSVDSYNSIIISDENKYRLNAIVSSVDIFDDKAIQKLDYRTNFSVDNENVTEEANKIVKIRITEAIDSLTLLDYQYFLIQYISKHIQQYKIISQNILTYIKYLTWIRDASLLLSNRLKLPLIKKEFNGELTKRTYDFCPHRGNCQINYGKKKGKCCAPHYVHNLVYNDVCILIKYLEKNNNTLFAFDQELFKILKQVNTTQFVINQMYIELSSFKNSITNHQNNIEKFHHNCKVDEPIVQSKPYRFSEMIKLIQEEDDDEEEEEKQQVQQPRSNINTYRVWKE
jgi:hypothetical protein